MHWKRLSLIPLLISMAYAADMSLEAIEARTAPIGEVKIEQTSGASAANAQVAVTADKGKSIYESTCVICHGSGASGAPIFGNAPAWEPRIAQGEATLVKHVISGFNLMPARGTCVQCSDDDIKAAVHYIVEQVKK